MIPARRYAEGESQYFPDHWDVQTKQLVIFMLAEAYNAGHQVGYKLGQGTGEGIAIQLLYDVIAKLQESK